MGYQTEEAYNFTPYFVFGAEKEDEDYGTEVGISGVFSSKPET